MIHDSDPVSKVIRRELSIGVSQSDRTWFPALNLAGQTGLIDNPGFAERQPIKEAFAAGAYDFMAKPRLVVEPVIDAVTHPDPGPREPATAR